MTKVATDTPGRGEVVDMPTISIKTHAAVDYVTGVALVLSPFVIRYPDSPMKDIALTFGAIILLYSAMTDYPLALLRFIPFPVHKAIDLIAGGGLAFAPVHFAVHGAPAVLFVVLGLVLIGMAFLTRGKSSPTGVDNPLVPGV